MVATRRGKCRSLSPAPSAASSSVHPRRPPNNSNTRQSLTTDFDPRCLCDSLMTSTGEKHVDSHYLAGGRLTGVWSEDVEVTC